MKLTAALGLPKEGGSTSFLGKTPAALSQNETLGEAKANLLDALKLVLKSQIDLVEKER
jgi:predicted RNase H-like HicB family nuclease